MNLLRKNTKSIILFAVYVLSLYAISYATSNGKTSMNFLKIPVGLRGVAMGEANVAATEGIDSLCWNPAGLSDIYTKEAVFMYNKWFQDITSQYVGYALPLDDEINKRRKGVIAASLNYLSCGNIQGYNADGTKSSVLKSNDIALSIGYGTSLSRLVKTGIVFKYLSENLAGYKATAYAIDLGFLWDARKHFSFGLNIQNLGTKVKFIKESDVLPLNYKLGMAYKKNIRSQLFTYTLDMNIPNDREIYASTGAEYWIKDILALRAGYKMGMDVGSGLRIGFGIKASVFQVDYAFSNFGDLGDTHRISIKAKFGKGVELDRISTLFFKGKTLYKEAKYSEAITIFNKLLEIDPDNKKAIEYVKRIIKKLQDNTKKE